MNESEVNEIVRRWAEEHGFHYKGVLRDGDVLVPSGDREVLIDHMLERVPERIWVEAKGDGSLSDALEGMARLAFAVYYGGGRGELACPSKLFKQINKHGDFLRWFGENLNIRIWDVETDKMCGNSKLSLKRPQKVAE